MLILAIDTSAIASAALLMDAELLASFATEDTRSHAEVLAPGVQGMLQEAAIDGSALDAIVVGVGPGPFTGLRAGIVTARTLAFAWQVPLYGVMSLDALAWEVETAPGSEFLVVTDARRREVYWAVYRSPAPDDAGRDGGLSDAAVGSGAAPVPEAGSELSLPGLASARLAVPSGLSTSGLSMADLLTANPSGRPAGPVLLDGPHVGPATDLPPLPAYGRGAGLYDEILDARLGFEDRYPMADSLGRVALARLAAGQPLADTTPLYLRESDAQVPGPRKRAL